MDAVEAADPEIGRQPQGAFFVLKDLPGLRHSVGHSEVPPVSAADAGAGARGDRLDVPPPARSQLLRDPLAGGRGVEVHPGGQRPRGGRGILPVSAGAVRRQGELRGDPRRIGLDVRPPLPQPGGAGSREETGVPLTCGIHPGIPWWLHRLKAAPFEDRKQGGVELPGELPGAFRRQGDGKATERGSRTGAFRGRAALLDEPQGRPVGVVVVVPAVQDLADPLRTSVRVGGEQEEAGRAPGERGPPLRGAFRQRPHRNRGLDPVSRLAEGDRHARLRRRRRFLASFRFPAPPPAPVLRTGGVGDEGEGVVSRDPLAAVAVVGDVEVQGYRVLQVPRQAGSAGDVVDVVGHVGGQVDPVLVPADRESGPTGRPPFRRCRAVPTRRRPSAR